MKQARLVQALLVLAATVSAQTTPPTCFGFNMTGGSSVDLLTFTAASPLTIFFTAPQTVTVDQIAIFENTFYGSSVNVAVHAVNPVTGAPVLPALANAPGGPFLMGSDWMPKPLIPPVSFAGGAPYALVCTPAPTSIGPFWGPRGAIGYDPSPAAVPLTYAGGSFNGLGVVPAGPTLGFRFGFRGPGCGARLAEVRMGGPSCGGVTAGVPLLCPLASTGGALTGNARPALGSQLLLQLIPQLVGATPPMPASLYWSFGSNPAGTPLNPPSPCSYHLNPASFSTLLGLGLQPLATPLFWSNGGYFAIPVPNLPALIGTPVEVQALIIDPAGVPSGFPGVNIRISNSLTLVPGL
jgi:hypothetical protein